MMDSISPNLILPLSHFCVDTSPSVVDRPCCPALIIAPMLSTGNADPNTPNIVASFNQANELFGSGSVAADMVNYYFLNNNFGELYVIGLTDTGVKSTGQIEIDNNATNTGTLSLNIGSTPYYTTVFTGDTPNEILTDVANLINSDQYALVTASVATNVLTITAKNAGSQGADIPITINNFYGESTPEGLTVTITAMSSVVSTYDLTNAFAALDQCCYDFIAIPFTDSYILSAMEEFMINERWSCDNLIGGRWYTTNRDNFTDQFTFLQANKFRYGSAIMSCPNDPDVAWRETAAFVGRTHLASCISPELSWYKLSLDGINCNTQICGNQCFTKNERNILATYGGTTTLCGDNGFKQIELETSLGVVSIGDDWRYPQIVYQTMRFIRDLKVFTEENYSRTLIVDDLSQVPDGSNVITPTALIGEIKSWALDTQSLNVDNINQFDNFIKITRDRYNPSRLNVDITVDFTNALRVLAFNITPRLNINTGVFT